MKSFPSQQSAASTVLDPTLNLKLLLNPNLWAEGIKIKSKMKKKTSRETP
jgi:hypothetical protein